MHLLCASRTFFKKIRQMYGLFFNYSTVLEKKLFLSKKIHYAIKKSYFRFLYGRPLIGLS